MTFISWRGSRPVSCDVACLRLKRVVTSRSHLPSEKRSLRFGHSRCDEGFLGVSQQIGRQNVGQLRVDQSHPLSYEDHGD